MTTLWWLHRTQHILDDAHKMLHLGMGSQKNSIYTLWRDMCHLCVLYTSEKDVTKQSSCLWLLAIVLAKLVIWQHCILDF